MCLSMQIVFPSNNHHSNSYLTDIIQWCFKKTSSLLQRWFWTSFFMVMMSVSSLLRIFRTRSVQFVNDHVTNKNLCETHSQLQIFVKWSFFKCHVLNEQRRTWALFLRENDFFDSCHCCLQNRSYCQTLLARMQLIRKSVKLPNRNI